MNTKMKGARIVVETLLSEKVDTIFGYIGGAVIPIYDALYDYRDRLRIIRPRHEQAGTHAADGYARATGKTGVVLVTSGPGATNTVTGIATAFMDSIPLLVITGQVPSTQIGNDAFQEADITGMTLAVTKASFQVRQVEDLERTLRQALVLASSGRPGPVLVDIPSDIQKNAAEYPALAKASDNPLTLAPALDSELVREALRLICHCQRPLVLAGGGVQRSRAARAVAKFCDRLRLPLVVTLMGHGLQPQDESLFFGGIGMHGTPAGNWALQHADLLIALGTRFSDRILGDVREFAPQARIIQVDIDPAELGKVKEVDMAIVGDVQQVVEAWLATRVKCSPGFSAWLDKLAAVRQESAPALADNGRLKPQRLIALLSHIFPPDTIVAADVGQNQMWVAQHFRFRRPRTLITSGGLGTMGFALPAAIGAKVGWPRRQVLAISGDGGFQMNIQELATVREYELAVKMVVLDNGHLGMVRQWQQLLCRSRYSGTVLDHNPDFANVARAFGIRARTISRPLEAESAVRELLGSREPMLLHARVDPLENVLPMVPPGESLSRMKMEL